MHFKKSFTVLALIFTVLSSPSQAYFGESIVDGFYNTAASTASWIKKNPGKTALGVVALGAASYWGCQEYQVNQARDAEIDKCLTPERSKAFFKIDEVMSCFENNFPNLEECLSSEDAKRAFSKRFSFDDLERCEKIMKDEMLMKRAVRTGKMPANAVYYSFLANSGSKELAQRVSGLSQGHYDRAVAMLSGKGDSKAFEAFVASLSK